MLIVFCRNHDAASFSSKFATPKYQTPLAFWFCRSIWVPSDLEHLLTLAMVLWYLSWVGNIEVLFLQSYRILGWYIRKQNWVPIWRKYLFIVFCVVKPWLKGVFSCSHSLGQAMTRRWGEQGPVPLSRDCARVEVKMKSTGLTRSFEIVRLWIFSSPCFLTFWKIV